MGRLPDDALLFTDLDGKPRSLYAVSSAWGSFAGRIGMPDVTFHALRHTHASQLIDAGVDIVTISKRLSHDLGRKLHTFSGSCRASLHFGVGHTTCRFDHPLNERKSVAPTRRSSVPFWPATNVVCARSAGATQKI
jgi:hypothetical protein